MKVTCDREKLWHAFQLASGVIPQRSPKPILENIKLEVSTDRATLMATDLEVGIRIDLPGFDIRFTFDQAALVPCQLGLPAKISSRPEWPTSTRSRANSRLSSVRRTLSASI